MHMPSACCLKDDDDVTWTKKTRKDKVFKGLDLLTSVGGVTLGSLDDSAPPPPHTFWHAVQTLACHCCYVWDD